MRDLDMILTLLLVLAIPFLLGVLTGFEIMKRRKRTLEDTHAELGRTFYQLVEQTTDPLRFTGPGVRVTRQIITQRNGTECKITFEAKQ